METSNMKEPSDMFKTTYSKNNIAAVAVSLLVLLCVLLLLFSNKIRREKYSDDRVCKANPRFLSQLAS